MCSQAARCLSTTVPRHVAMADGGRAVDDIDLAFDYPSEMQETYTTPAGAHQARVDKEMGYPDQRILYVMSATVVVAHTRAERRQCPSFLFLDASVPLPFHRPRPDTNHARLLPRYALIGSIGAIGLYGAIMSTLYPPDHVPKLSAAPTPTATVEPKGYVTATHGNKSMHLPSQKATDSKMERFIGRGG